MGKELPQPQDIFGFTERELLFDRLSHKRFMQVVEDEKTAIQRSEVSINTYGEFLFVTTSRGEGDKRLYVTFYGLGYHDYRERWITDEWFWYKSYSYPNSFEQNLSREELLELIRERQEQIATYPSEITPSKRGKLFETLADLTDEDGALAEMEDMDDMDDLFGD